jgi:DNA polymerase-3 subunit gamma/tau
LPIPEIWVKKKLKVDSPSVEKTKTSSGNKLDKEISIPTTRKINLVEREQSTSNISIKTLLNPSPNKDKEVITEIKKEPFSQEELADKWRRFAYSIKNKDLDLYSTLSANDPVLKDNFRIELSIYNTAQKADIDIRKPELLGYLRKQLNNTILDLHLVIDKSHVPKGIFTEKDKYKKLVEKNPEVDKLRKKFGLSF